MRKRILTNAQIYQFNTANKADTIVIDNEEISAIGFADELIPQFNCDALLVDVHQLIVMPSFTDSHIHLMAYGLSLQRVNVEVPSKDECLARISERIKVKDKGKWIVGHGWNHNTWSQGYGNKEDLDKLSNHHPIYLTNKSLHSAWVNSLALKKAGINKNTPDPVNGKIMRDVLGEPTGILLESAMDLVASVIPDPDQFERESAILAAQSTLNQFGITAVHDFDPWNVYDTLVNLRSQNKISLRVTKGIPESYLDKAIDKKLQSGNGDNWLKIGWLKLFADGALGPQTAAMLEPYENSHSTGMLFLNKDEIIAYGEKALPAGIALAVHAIGDRVNKEVLCALSDLNEMGLLVKPSLFSRIEHVQIIDPADIPTLYSLNICASMQPYHAISDMEIAEKYWGNRCVNAYAWQSILNSGTKMIFGSDAPVDSPNPFYGLHAAVNRKQLESCFENEPGWTTNQCIDLLDAINAYTRTSSLIGGFGNKTGKLQPGFAADLILLPKDFQNVQLDSIHCTLPLATMVNGKWVYKNDKIDLEFD